ncbi:MAG TPA: glycosyltransferase family 39 protein [Pyrinomonadaceae bacterium]|nr:glycosyltransferase family 39 protein [Pyrinomonadaceae bacterium]
MTQKSESKNSNLALILKVLWAAVLLFGFLYFRGEDLGKLGSLLGNLTDGKLFGANGFGESIAGIFSASLIAASWFGFGSLITNLLKKFFAKDENAENDSPFLETARSFAVGAGIWSLIWFFLGIFGAYNKISAIVAVIFGVCLAVWKFLENRKSVEKSNENFDIAGKIAFGLVLFLLVLALISAIAPPIAKDTLLYHFAVPKNFIAAGNNSVIEGNIASYLALGTEMHVVWAMLLGNSVNARVGEISAGVTVFAFLPILLVAIYGWSRELGLNKTWAMISALLFASIPTVYHVASGGYIDLALTLFVTLAVHSIARWWHDLSNERLVFAAILLGAALSVKLTAAFTIIALAFIVLLRIREEQTAEKPQITQIFTKGFLTFLAAGLLASPWYLRDWAATGSPIFPFYMNLWKGTATGWDSERSVLFQVINTHYGGFPKGITDYLISPVMISLRAQPELPEFFDGVLGIAFLFGIPLIIWAWRRSLLKTELKLGILVAGLLFLFWLFTSQQLRYLLPIFPILAISICFSASLLSLENKLSKQVWTAIFLIISFVGTGVTLAWFAQKSPLQVALGGETRDEYLTANIDYYPYYQLINTQLPPDAKVWLINMRRDSYLIEKPYFSDYMFEDWTLKQFSEESNSVNELRAKAKKLGITHILARHDFLLDFDKSVVVDPQKRTETENRKKLQMVKDFILDGNNTLKADKRFSLAKLP